MFLYKYEDKNLVLTSARKEPQSFAVTLTRDYEKVTLQLSNEKENVPFKFDATLTMVFVIVFYKLQSNL